MTIEITEKKDEPEKKVDEEDIKQTLKQADEYEKLKQSNDLFEQEIQRKEELMAKLSLGGRALAGQPEEKQEDKDKKEAAEHLKAYEG